MALKKENRAARRLLVRLKHPNHALKSQVVLAYYRAQIVKEYPLYQQSVVLFPGGRRAFKVCQDKLQAWAEIVEPKYIFLDCGGVIKTLLPERGNDWQTPFSFINGVPESLALMAHYGYEAVVVSNQPAVGEGMMTLEELQRVSAEAVAIIEKAGGMVAGIFYCPHVKADNCDCCKPKDGLFLAAKRELCLANLSGYYIGDQEKDAQVARQVGLEPIIVLTGRTKFYAETENWSAVPRFVLADLAEAVQLIIGKHLLSPRN